jgi:hypothetical protein
MPLLAAGIDNLSAVRRANFKSWQSGANRVMAAGSRQIQQQLAATGFLN